MLNLETLHKDHALSEIYEVLTVHDCEIQRLPLNVRECLVRAYNDLSPVKLPTRQHLKRNKLKWLQDATDPKNIRPYLKYLHGCDGWLIGASGHALHATSCGLNGTYKVVGEGKKLDLEQVDDDSFSTRAVQVFKRIEDNCLQHDDSGLLTRHIYNQVVKCGRVYIAIPDHTGKIWHYDSALIYKAFWMVESIVCNVSDNGELLLTIDPNHKAIIMPCIM
jgi:hypothetical protein